VAQQVIAAGQTATLTVKFTPASAATVSGTVTVTSNATNSPITISLSGTGTQPVTHSVTLSWTASTSSVVGYNVYRSTVSGGPYTLLTGTPVAASPYTDSSSVQAGVTYYYVVTAVDSNGNESVFSNEASVTVPTP
jgi:fibronectin type 3 domain-containing protein